MTQRLIGPYCYQDPTSYDPTPNWALLPPGPNSLGPARRPGPSALGGSISFKIGACN